MGRIAVFLLVLIVAGLGARVLFVDARTPDEPSSPPKPLPPSALVPPSRSTDSLPQPSLLIDSNPDLDQNTEPADCPGTPGPPADPEPEPPAPH